MKFSAFLLLLSIHCAGFAQEIVNAIPLRLRGDSDVFQIEDNAKGEVVLFVSDAKKVNVFRLDKTLKMVDSMTAARPEKAYTQIIGNTVENGNPVLFWSSKNHEKISSWLYDFGSRNMATYEHLLNFKEEKFVQQFSLNNKLYLLTALKNSNTLKIYSFDSRGKMETKTIEFTSYMFFDSKFKQTTFYGVLEEDLKPFEEPFALEYIVPENPISLTQSAKKRKCYVKDNNIVLTFDANTNFTQLIYIDLSTFTASEKVIYKPYVYSKRPSGLNSNSFLIGEKLFQIKASDDELFVTIKKLNDTLIKEYKVDQKSEITFKNSDIILENKSPRPVDTWVYKKTSQFMSRINNYNLGVSCYDTDGKYLLTMGSVSASDDRQTWGDYVAAGILLGGLGIVFVMFVNPTYENFNAYANRKVIYINGLFDYNGNHLAGEIKPLAFDKIRHFTTDNPDLSSQTLFKIGTSYYLGSYENKNYTFRKFDDGY